jgi:diacylglycerol kinase family enzyme
VRRLLLISNRTAHRVSGYGRDVIVRALAAEFKVDEVETTRQGHATELARAAAADGIDVVAALGGDGTVNEVTNGLAGTEAALAILPAGLANVFARALGIPGDPIEATGWLLQNAGAAPRRVTLGRAGERYFAVSCGVGFDAAVVREVERRQPGKKRAGDWFFAWTGIRVFWRGFDRRSPAIGVTWGPGPGDRADRLFVAIIQNASPYTVFRGREMRLCPDADLDGGLDLLALDSFRLRVVVSVALSAFGPGRHVRRRHVTSVRSQTRFDVECATPLPVQVDGEYMGEHRRLSVESVPGALRVLC